MNQLVFFLEEMSAESLLKALLPRILPSSIDYRCVVFEGKQDLEKQLVKKIRGYRVPRARFVVLRDQDASNCKLVKQALIKKCKEAGHPQACVRIACHELESWYLADLAAIEKGFGLKGLQRSQNKKPYADPDSMGSPSKKLMQIAPCYQKISGSRLIGPYLDLQNSRSRSFMHFVKAVQNLAAQIVSS